MKIIPSADGRKILSDTEFQAIGEAYLKEVGHSKELEDKVSAQARESVKVEMQALTDENARLKAENVKLSAEVAGFPAKLKEVEASVNTRASQRAADIARTCGLDAPIPIAGVSVESHGLRDKLAAETDPTKRANISREIKRVESEAKKIA